MSRQPDLDADLVELNISVAGLSVSVRGSPERAAAFVRGLSEPGTPARSFQDHASSSFQVSPVHSDPIGLIRSSPPSAYSDRSYSQISSRSAFSETRASILRGFPSVPVHLLELAPRLIGSRLSGVDRVRRAWIAGCWAGATKAGRIQSPNRTPSIDLGNKIYVVIRCVGLDCPRIFGSSRSFHSAVGSLENSDTICHGFPTEIEASIYLEGAGEELAVPI